MVLAFAERLIELGLVDVELHGEQVRQLAQEFSVKKKKEWIEVEGINERCKANRTNGLPCDRRSTLTSHYCRLHQKKLMAEPAKETNHDQLIPLEVVAEEIQGIVYYIDAFNNIYCTEDILKGIPNPSVVGRYEKIGQSYYIPENGLKFL